jgi:hypothetical protein
MEVQMKLLTHFRFFYKMLPGPEYSGEYYCKIG